MIIDKLRAIFVRVLQNSVFHFFQYFRKFWREIIKIVFQPNIRLYLVFSKLSMRKLENVFHLSTNNHELLQFNANNPNQNYNN